MPTPAEYVAWRFLHPGEEPLPAMGVREPRRPRPPTFTPGVALPEPAQYDETADAGARVTFVVAR